MGGDSRLALTLFLSAVFHCVVVLRFPGTTEESISNQIEPVLLSPVPRSSPGTGGGGGRLSLKDLGIKWSRSGHLSIPEGRVDDTGGVGRRGFGHGTGLEEMKGTVLQNALYEKINAALIYPDEFREAKIEGEVAAEIFFERGGFIEEKTRVRSRSDYLRVYVHRLLRETLKHHSVVGKEPVRIFCSFRFELLDTQNPFFNELPVLQQSGMLGNTLHFSRKGELVGTWHLGPVSGYGLYAAVNLAWFIEKAENALSDKEQIDPLRKYRSDPLWRKSH